jgi:hypothetical protein
MDSSEKIYIFQNNKPYKVSTLQSDMMKKTLSVLMLSMALVLTLGLVAAQSGSIWTTTENCGEDPQNVNEYAIGDVVYINGANFCEGTYAGDITGQGGSENAQASCDPNVVVASGTVTTNADGTFCFQAYTVANDDCGVYKSTVDSNKHDAYHVNTDMIVPEFGTTIGIATALGALGVFFLVRRK